jgi:nucleoside-diphosphate-sugar epimerase
MRTVLVTGGAGFIGGYVVRDLIGRGYTVTVLDTRGRTVPGATTILGDIRDTAAVSEAVTRSDGVVHLAGLLGTAEMVKTPRPAVEVNVMGALNVLEAAAANDVPLVNISVGNHWMDNTYSITKDTADRFTRMYRRFRGARVANVRAFDAYGPGQTAPAPFGPSHVRKVIPSFACRALAGLPIEVYGDGLQTIDLIHASDVARILVSGLEEVDAGREPSVPEAGSGVPITVLDVAKLIIGIVGSGSITHLPMRPGESPGAVIVAASVLSGLVPLSVGLPPTVESYR